MSIKNYTPSGGTSDALVRPVMLGLITETDFQECDETFPGIARFYGELKDKPKTFLELLWAYTHGQCECSESPRVATVGASSRVSL